MFRNILFTLLPFFVFGQVISPTNPYTKNFVSVKQKQTGFAKKSAQQQSPKLSDIENAFDIYWKDKDHTKKGSGYKPFKRWAHHWKDYLQENGTIAPPVMLWEAWERKQKAESQQSPSGIPDENIINWSNLGPAVVTNTSVSISGQGRINTFIKDPNNPQTLYVGAPAGGIWKSTDDGENWTPLSDNLPQIGVSGIAIDPFDSNIIYIATGDDDAGDSYSVGVMKSTDAGETWNPTGLSYFYTNQKTTNEIYIDPTNNNHIWVASTDGLQKSEDGGDSWTIKQVGNIVDFKLHTDYANNSIIYAVGYNNNESKFYRSDDKGESFATIESIPNDSNRIVLETTPAAPNVVYVLSAYDNGDGTYTGQNAFQGVYVSTDAGLNFNKTAENDDIFGSGQSWYDMALTVSDTDPNVIFVGVLNIWKSTDGGNEFTQLNSWSQRTPSFTHADIHFMRYFDGTLYAGTDGGIYRSSNDGANFEDLSNTLSIAQIYTVSTSKPDSSKLASGLQDCGGFAFSGSNWNSYHGGDGMGSAVDPFIENTYYGMTQYGGGLYKTSTAGVGGWNNTEFIASSPVEGQWVTPLEFSKNGDLYAGYDQLYKLQGSQWRKLSNHNFPYKLRFIKIDPKNSNIVYVATWFNVYKSIDGGSNFTNILSSGQYIRSIEIDLVDNNLWVLDSYSLHHSSDQGNTWSSEQTGLESATSLKLQQYSQEKSLYLGTILGVYYSDNDINGWHSISNDLPNVKITDVEINSNDNILTVSTYGRGIWQTPIPTVTRPSIDIDLIRINTEVESDYRCDNKLIGNFEVFNNGASPITSFSYEITINDVSYGFSNWTGNIPPGELKIVQLDIEHEPEIGTNTISVNLSHPEETLTSNNYLDKVLEVFIPSNYSAQLNTTYIFESSETNWLIIGDSIWEKGVPQGQSLNQVNSGSYAYATNLNGNHPNNSTSSLVSPCYDLSQLESGNVRFYLSYELETNYDYIYFQYSIDNGLNWLNLDVYNGFDSDLKEYSYPLSQSMLFENVIFRFHLVSDQYVNEEGAVIDDFIVEGTSLNIKNIVDRNINIYPNPTTGRFTIDTNGQFELKNIRIFNLESKLIYKKELVNNSMCEVNFSPLKGIYFVELSTSDKRKIIRKLIVE